jgi:hypothetical protein
MGRRSRASWRDLALAIVWLFGAAMPASGQDPVFDHLRSGFPLTGAHRRIPCESCHGGAAFEGTPRDCRTCHGNTGSLALTGKPANHFQTASPCDDCHSTIAWSPARFDHAVVTAACSTCHNGRTATGKSPGHLPTPNSCDDCHTTAAWSPARFDHAVVTAACSTCHNGMTATGKSPSHLPTPNSCDDCHTTAAWSPARFDHTVVTASCGTCHNGRTATGKPSNHFITSLECSECHNTSVWSASTFRHSSPNYPSGHRQVGDCTACHVANTEASAWLTPSFKPDCAGCHATRFRPSPHTKVDSPQQLYSVSELRDCSGACHLYTDATLTQIQERRSGHHNPARGGW